MNKAEMIEHIATDSGVSKSVAGKALEAFVRGVTKAVASGDDVAITGLGTFKSVKRAAREGRNPLTGEKLKIPAKVAAKFSPAKALKDAVAAGKKRKN
ncbi:MAG: DNA-binding protein HU [Betaproteobacteria bacterium]|nr:DNA-binding protein HU [Betaproteobacteria bacterium]